MRLFLLFLSFSLLYAILSDYADDLCYKPHDKSRGIGGRPPFSAATSRVALALNSLLTIKESARLFLSQRACTELSFVTRKLFSLCRQVILFQRSSQTLIKQYDGVDNF